MLEFTTHTGLVLNKYKRDDEKWVVRLYSDHEMERAKTLYLGDDETAAQREYAKWVKHYQQREEVEKTIA